MKQSLTSGRTGPQIMALCNNWFQGIVHWDMPLADLPQVRSGMSFRSFVQLMSWARFILKHYLRRLKKESRAILLCAKHYTQKIKAIALEGIEHFERKNCHKRSLRFFFQQGWGGCFFREGRRILWSFEVYALGTLENIKIDRFIHMWRTSCLGKILSPVVPWNRDREKEKNHHHFIF